MTSLHPDHLPWHRGDPETYYADKLSLCRQPGADLTVANGDSLCCGAAAALGPRVEWVTAPRGTRPLVGPAGPARHNLRNARIARACLVALGVPEATDDDALAKAAGGFEHLESRLRPVGEVDGVLFGRQPLHQRAAHPGGGGRLPAAGWRSCWAGPRHRLRTAGRGPRRPPRSDAGRGHGIRGRAACGAEAAAGTVEVTEGEDLDTATRTAYEWARPDGVVLLSPAAPSFDRYRDYRARSAAFNAALTRLLRR